MNFRCFLILVSLSCFAGGCAMQNDEMADGSSDIHKADGRQYNYWAERYLKRNHNNRSDKQTPPPQRVPATVEWRSKVPQEYKKPAYGYRDEDGFLVKYKIGDKKQPAEIHRENPKATGKVTGGKEVELAGYLSPRRDELDERKKKVDFENNFYKKLENKYLVGNTSLKQEVDCYNSSARTDTEAPIIITRSRKQENSIQDEPVIIPETPVIRKAEEAQITATHGGKEASKTPDQKRRRFFWNRNREPQKRKAVREMELTPIERERKLARTKQAGVESGVPQIDIKEFAVAQINTEITGKQADPQGVVPEVVARTFTEAMMDIRNKKWSAAQKKLDQVIIQSPDFCKAYFWHGVVNSRQGNLSKAYTDFCAGINLNPPDVYLYHYQRSLVHIRQENFGAAINDLNQTILLNQNMYEAYLVRAKVRSELDDNHSAIRDLDRVIFLHPELKKAYLMRARLYRKIGMNSKANADFRMAVD